MILYGGKKAENEREGQGEDGSVMSRLMRRYRTDGRGEWGGMRGGRRSVSLCRKT